MRLGIHSDYVVHLGVLLHRLRIILEAFGIVRKRDPAKILDEPSYTLDREAVGTCDDICFLRPREEPRAVRVAHGPCVIAVKEESVLAVALELFPSDDLLAVNGLLKQKDKRRYCKIQSARKAAPYCCLRKISVIFGKHYRIDVSAGEIVI